MRVSRQRAAAVLFACAEDEKAGTGVDGDWVRRVGELSDLCEESGVRTHVAFLGTALLAKATVPLVDARALKVSAGTSGAYSARGLATGVLALHAAELGVHLGVTGREPLNNQPYFRIARFTFGSVQSLVHPSTHAAIRRLDRFLDLIEEMDEAAAHGALRAFIRVRREAMPVYPTEIGLPAGASRTDFVARIEHLCSDSEGGRCAQAVVAALMDAVHGPALVLSGRINDPDRNLGGDVGVLRGEEPWWVFEVRDKPVILADAINFAAKCAENGVLRAGVVAVATRQRVDQFEEAELWASERGVCLTVFTSWRDVLKQAVWWSPDEETELLERLWERVPTRLEEVEASPGSVERWLAGAAA